MFMSASQAQADWVGKTGTVRLAGDLMYAICFQDNIPANCGGYLFGEFWINKE